MFDVLCFMFDDYDDVVHKCKKDAIRNSTTIKNTSDSIIDKLIRPQTTLALTKESFFEKYKTLIILFGLVILLLIIGIIIYHFYTKEE